MCITYNNYGCIWITTNCEKFLEMGIPVHLACLLRIMYAGQSATVRTVYGTIRSDQISRSVMSDSLRPHESQHARPPGPSPTPRVH